MSLFNSCKKIVVIGLSMVTIASLTSGCSIKPPSTKQAETIAACVVSHASPERLHMMGESYALAESTGIGRNDAWDCQDGRWGVAFSSDFRKAMEPQMAAALLNAPAGREGMYAGTFGRQFDAKQRVVLGKLGMFFDNARRAALQGLTCNTIEPQAAQIVGKLDFPFAIAVLGVQANIAQPEIAQRAADKLLERVNLLIPAGAVEKCEKNDGKAQFTEYAKQLHQFYQAEHPWAPGCGVRQSGEDLNLVCNGDKAAKPVEPKKVG